MTSEMHEEVKRELATLQARKAKAESLGNESIEKYQDAYDKICARIRLLTDVLAAEADGPARRLISLIRELIDMEWHAGAMRFADTLLPNIEFKLKNAEFAIAAAYEQGDNDKALTAIAGYAEILRELNRKLCEMDGAQTMFGFEPTDEKTPFDH